MVESLYLLLTTTYLNQITELDIYKCVFPFFVPNNLSDLSFDFIDEAEISRVCLTDCNSANYETVIIIMK